MLIILAVEFCIALSFIKRAEFRGYIFCLNLIKNEKCKKNTKQTVEHKHYLYETFYIYIYVKGILYDVGLVWPP